MNEPEAPDEAGRPATKGTTRTYEAEGLVVRWDASLCTHAAACTRALPHVFNPVARPWVDVSADSAEAIKAAIDRCPTSALTYEGERARPGSPVTIEAQPGGPLHVRGPVAVTDAEQGAVATGTRFALCRCGASRNKPFCDNSHRLA